jgi:hypothetical protein
MVFFSVAFFYPFPVPKYLAKLTGKSDKEWICEKKKAQPRADISG